MGMRALFRPHTAYNSITWPIIIFFGLNQHYLLGTTKCDILCNFSDTFLENFEHMCIMGFLPFANCNTYLYDYEKNSGLIPKEPRVFWNLNVKYFKANIWTDF